MKATESTTAHTVRLTLAPALVLGLSIGWGVGCSKPPATTGAQRTTTDSESSSVPASSSVSEAEKTRELKEKAAGYEERYQEIQESDMTAEQKAQAAGELVDEQQRTVREAEDGPPAEASEDPEQ